MTRKIQIANGNESCIITWRDSVLSLLPSGTTDLSTTPASAGQGVTTQKRILKRT